MRMTRTSRLKLSAFRVAPIVVLALAPLLGAGDCGLGLCDYESDPNCVDPERAQVSGTINVPQASNSALFKRVDGDLANEIKRQVRDARERGQLPFDVGEPKKIGRTLPPLSSRNAVPKAKTATQRFRPGEMIVKGKDPIRFAKAEISRALENYLHDRFMPVSVDVRLCGTDYRCLADIKRADGKPLDLAETYEAVMWTDRAPFLEYAEKNLILQMAAQPNDEFFTLQWHYAIMDLPTAWDITVGDPSRVAAVVDTGVLYDHPDFVNTDGSSRIIGKGADLIDDPSVSLDGDGRDGDGYDAGDNECGDGCNSYHGTHVSGTIGAATDNGVDVAGVTWSGSILPVRVLGAGGGSLADIADGIEWAVGNHVDGVEDNATPADVINMSLGGSGQSQVMDDAVHDAVGTGCIVVVAAGNDNVDATNSTPANSPDAIVVAAHGNVGPTQATPKKASYSNFGDKVDVAAPGGEQAEDLDGDGQGDGVLSTLGKQGSGGKVDFDVEYYQGTSMATPHVAGLSMLLKSLDPSLDQEAVRTILKQSASHDLDCPEGCGAGRVSAAAAVTLQSKGSLDGTVIASPSFLRVGKGQTETPVVFKDLGSTAATVTFSLSGGDRDSCALDSAGGHVDAGGQIVATVTITRNGAADDTGECDVTASGDNISTQARVVWTGDVIAPLTEVTVGPVQIGKGGALKVITSRIVQTSKLENFAYKLFNLDPGTYIIVGLVDTNNNGSFDDDVDAVGIYTPPTAGNDGTACTTAQCGQISVKAGDNIAHADFVVAPGFTPGQGGGPGTGSGVLGGACTDSTECGNGLYCETTFPNGYCTSSCASDTDCGNGVCATLQDPPPSNNQFQVCLESCATDADCNRSGYKCDPSDNTCFPG